MPSNQACSFCVLVGGQKLEEKVKDSLPYVEVDILGPHGRTETTIYEVDGEEESQEIPILPYEIKIHYFAQRNYPVFAFVYIDGFSVCRLFMRSDKRTMTVHGFRDGNEGMKEFLFSLPKLGAEQDKISNPERGQQRDIGVIEVIFKEAIYSKTVYGNNSHGNHNAIQRKLEFTQATKKESNSITNGRYLMATTKVGDSLQQQPRKRKGPYSKDIHSEGRELSRLKLHYRIKSTIVNVGSVTVEDDEDEESEISEMEDEDAPTFTGIFITVNDEDDDVPVEVVTIDDEKEHKVPSRQQLQNITIADNNDKNALVRKVGSRCGCTITCIDDNESKNKVQSRDWSQNGIITIADNHDEKVPAGGECSKSASIIYIDVDEDEKVSLKRIVQNDLITKDEDDKVPLRHLSNGPLKSKDGTTVGDDRKSPIREPLQMGIFDRDE